MKNLTIKSLVLLIVFFASACNLDEIENPNAPTYESFTNGATQADIRLLAQGLEAVMRNDLSFHTQTVSILGREYYDLTGVDPRYTGELLSGFLDNNGFLTTRAYAALYKIVQSANLLETATVNNGAAFDNATIAGYVGYAQTIKAYALMLLASRQYTNGIRLEVSDPNNLGPNVDYDAALSGIQTLLGTALSNLESATDEFDFQISSGFAGFDTPETFIEFNRGIAARVAIYQGDKAAARGYLNDSFIEFDSASMNNGVYHIFGLTGNDIANPLYYIPNQSAQEYMAHDSFVGDAEANDARLWKVGLFLDGDGNPARQMFDGLSADYQVRLYESNIDPVPMMRNEELVLLWAEANIGSDNAEAVNALNAIRGAAGLPDYSGATDDASLVNELLRQRRYSLFGEGHRWIDMRRYNRLDDLPTDRSGDAIPEAFPTPVTELQG